MDKKQLAEMIKEVRKKALKEIIGKPGSYNPVHHKATHGEDPESPNQYAHKMEEGRSPVFSGGAQGKSALGGKRLQSRFHHQRKRGRQNQKNRFLNSIREKTEMELGPTDTGQKGSKEEKVSVNPTDNTSSANGQMNKNTVKETKEK